MINGKKNMDSKKLCGIYSQKIQFLGRTKESALDSNTRAVDPQGNKDDTPVRFEWEVFN